MYCTELNLYVHDFPGHCIYFYLIILVTVLSHLKLTHRINLSVRIYL